MSSHKYAGLPDIAKPEYAHTLSSNSASSVSHRLRRLKAELALLEADASTAPVDTDGAEATELIRDIVDAKSRLEKIGKEREGRSRLVNVVVQETPGTAVKEKEEPEKSAEDNETDKATSATTQGANGDATLSVRDIAEMDKRVGELEKIVGASTTAVDETSPLPPPLLPLLTRLSTQLAVLTQPRHIDNISRRLKLLLSDLDRLSAASGSSASASQQQQRKPSGHPPSSSHPQGQGAPQNASISPTPHTDALAPVLTRLTPLLPHIPQLLTRLRTLSALHANAALFQSTLESLEAEQRRVRAGLTELEDAINAVEGSVKENEGVVKGNVKALEERVSGVMKRVENLETIEMEKEDSGEFVGEEAVVLEA
ncbi:hypothetical protein EIP86_001220 [Pleurotus ostreatoroseus]|nr:hypothetical protein EIP86_001220 [Pleurotus ostreatoroseus]